MRFNGDRSIGLSADSYQTIKSIGYLRASDFFLLLPFNNLARRPFVVGRWSCIRVVEHRTNWKHCRKQQARSLVFRNKSLHRQAVARPTPLDMRCRSACCFRVTTRHLHLLETEKQPVMRQITIGLLSIQNHKVNGDFKSKSL
jgi:hypothetical protein